MNRLYTSLITAQRASKNSPGSLSWFLLSCAVMKILSFIFSFYILFLATLPGFKMTPEGFDVSIEACCTDSCELETDSDDNQPSSSDHDSENTGCNPFQFCKCCSGFNGNIAVSGLIPVSTYLDNFSPNIEEDLPQVSIDFWQPPKIS